MKCPRCAVEMDLPELADGPESDSDEPEEAVAASPVHSHAEDSFEQGAEEEEETEEPEADKEEEEEAEKA